MKILSTNTVWTPEDLSTVTDIGLEQSLDLAEMTEKQVNRIWSAVEELYRTGNHPMISLCIRRRGSIVINRSIGHADGNGPEDSPNTPKKVAKANTPVCLFSATKLVTAMLVHLFDQEGTINLLDRKSVV